jgi:hypothetical protein
MANYATHTQVISYSTQDGEIVNTTFTYVGNSESGLNATIAGLTTNEHHVLAVVQAQIRSMVFYSNEAITILTNSSGSPQDTITLGAGKQLIWDVDTQALCPFSADVTSLYITNTNSGPASVVIRILLEI